MVSAFCKVLDRQLGNRIVIGFGPGIPGSLRAALKSTIGMRFLRNIRAISSVSIRAMIPSPCQVESQDGGVAHVLVPEAERTSFALVARRPEFLRAILANKRWMFSTNNAIDLRFFIQGL